MRANLSVALAAALALVAPSLAAPTHGKPKPQVAHPGGKSQIIITAQNTVNGTIPVDVISGSKAATHKVFSAAAAAGTQQLSFALVNNLASSNVHAYVTGNDVNNAAVMLGTNGQWYYPNAAGQSTPQAITGAVAIPLGPQGSTTTVTLPDYLSSARIWFADGTLDFFVLQNSLGQQAIVQPSSANSADPSSATNWGFVELTNTADGGIYANISYVDFVGMVLGMQLDGSSGTQKALGLPASAASSICADLVTQAGIDGAPWDKLCITDASGNALRILAPSDYISSNGGAFADYWTAYIDQVYTTYQTSTLTVDTQGAAGQVACTSDGTTLTCAGDELPYAKPAPADIFGCSSGPFANTGSDTHKAVLARLCAAFNRGTLLLPGGNVTPSAAVGSDKYYTTSPCNHFSRVVHKYELDGKGYAFSYDDVNPDGENQSGTVTDPTPTLLTVTLGGPTGIQGGANNVTSAKPRI